MLTGRFLSGFLVVVLAAFAGMFGIGLVNHRVFTPVSLAPQMDGVSADGWLEDGAVMEFKNLYSRGNVLNIDWNPWRPAGTAPADIEVSVCGTVVLRFQVTGSPTPIPLKGSCEPRSVSFHVLNPFTPGPHDSRSLGAQFRTLRIDSRFGVAILSLEKLIAGFLAALLLMLPLWLGFIRTSLGLVVPVTVASGLLAIIYFSGEGLDKVLPLWLTLTLVSWGVAYSGYDNETTESKGQFGWTSFFLASLIVGLAAGVRIYGIDFGLPSNFHPDEVPKINAIERMVQSGTLNPDYFLHPSLLLYSTYGMSTLLEWLGNDNPFRDRTFFAGRLVSLTAGTLSVFLVYLIGRRLFSERAALLSSLILAVAPLHVTCSRYLKEDALLTFFVLFTTLVVILSVQFKKPWMLIFAGFLAGVAGGSKYSGVLVAATLVGAPWYASRSWLPDKRFLFWAIAAFAFVPVGFLCTTPYAYYNYAKFIKDFDSESRHMSTGHTQSIDSWSQLWMYHFGRSIVPGMHLVCAGLSLIGAGWLLVKRRYEGLIVVAMVLLFYLPAEYVKAKPAPQPERYILPCLPFLALCAGALMADVTRRRSGLVFLATTVLVVALPTIRTVELASEVRADTRDQMAAWMIQNIPLGSKILVDWKPYAPRFWNNEFNIEYVHRANILPNLDTKALKSSGANYLIMSSLFYDRYLSQPESNPLLRQRIREVFQRVPIVREFAPRYGTYGFHNPRLTLFSLDKADFEQLEQELVAKREGRLEFTSNQVRTSGKIR